MKRQKAQLNTGKLITTRINDYISMWERRCYRQGIPDEVTNKLISSGRVPSYKAIAIALLKNDVSLKSLGFSEPKSEYYDYYKRRELAARKA